MLSPVQNPPFVMAFISRRMFGVVLEPVSRVYARFFLASIVATVIAIVERLCGLDARVRAVVEIGVSLQNGCAFCADLHAYEHKNVLAKETLEQILVGDFSALSEREAAAVEAAISWSGGSMRPDVQRRLDQHFTEPEIARLIWLTAAISFFNLQSRALQFKSHGLSHIEFQGTH